MRKTKKNSANSQNLRIASIFFILVVSLIVVSLIIKLITLARTSKFDGNHRFTIIISSKNQIEVLSFAPDTRSISVLTLPKNQEVQKIGSFLEIPIDGTIINKEDKLSHTDVQSQLFYLFIHYRRLETNLTILDMARLWYFSLGVSSSAIHTQDISSKIISTNDIDNLSSSYFSDHAILSEKSSIHIINGTDVPGLGSRLARLVTNMGGNVVAVSTSDNAIEKSVILFSNKSSYTSKRLSRVLGIKEEKSTENSISDIAIIIGKDMTTSIVF